MLTARTLDYGRIQDIPKALLHLLKNATYLFITIGGTMDGFLLAGKHYLSIQYLIWVHP